MCVFIVFSGCYVPYCTLFYLFQDTVADHSRGSPRNREHSDSDNGSMSPGFDFKLPPDNETGSMSPGLDFELTTHKKTGSLDFDFEWDSPKKTDIYHFS